MKTMMIVWAALAVPVFSQPVAEYVTTTAELRAALATVRDRPLAVAVEKGHKAAPVRLEVKCITLDTRANWYDAHQSSGCTEVMILEETTRGEITPVVATEEKPAVCYEVDLAFSDGTVTFQGFTSEVSARAFMEHAGAVGVFVDRQLCPDPFPQCTTTKFYPARLVDSVTLTRWECDAPRSTR